MVNRIDLNNLTFEELDNYISNESKIYNSVVATTNLENSGDSRHLKKPLNFKIPN